MSVPKAATVSELNASQTPTEELQELRLLRRLSRELDDLIEESLRERESLTLTFKRVFSPLLALTGASAIVVTTQNEELAQQTFSEGDFGDVFPGSVLQQNAGVRLMTLGGRSVTVATQPLDVVGAHLGDVGLVFEGDRLADASLLAQMTETIAEELDTVLVLVQTAAEKHQLILHFNHHLSNPVFEVGMDQAVLALSQRVSVPGFLLIYRDAVRHDVLHYRSYKRGHLEFESGEQPNPALEQVIARAGPTLLSPNDQELRRVLGDNRYTEAVLIGGGAANSSAPLGKILVWSSADGFSAYTIDLLRVLASALSQRLVDYNRERIHLSQFFSSPVIDELLKESAYSERYLASRDEEVGILFADINGFTRLCEQGLKQPARIGRFVDRWSKVVVELLWKHGGVFDKMVGDCVIGLFGPPFFRSSPLKRAEAAVRAALEIQAFTQQMTAEAEVREICEKIGLPGLGVAIGVNLSNAYCGLVGPNQNYTGFSTGMNQTARLQSLGGFRETLVMEPVVKALASTTDPALKALDFGALTETTVKNVAFPLRYHVVSAPTTR